MKKNSRKVLFNEETVEESKVSLQDCLRGFLYGDGIFETLRARNYRIFRWKEHWNRLKKGVKLCNLEIRKDMKIFEEEIISLLEENNLKDAYIRVNIWRREPSHFDPGNKKGTNFLVISRKFKPYPEKLYKKGVRCFVSKNFSKNEHSVLTYIKSFNYMENILARQEAKRNFCDDSILLNSKGNIAEATTSNIFFVKNGIVFTPDIKCGLLPGITRKLIFEICSQCGIKLKEGHFFSAGLKKADEIFLTNTLMGIMPVSEVKGIFKSKGSKLTYFLKEQLEKIFKGETNE